MDSVFNILFPKTCSICSRKGSYLCDTCKKLFRRVLPECYICRRISPKFKTHDSCKKNYSLDSIFVSWEYNSLTSNLLKKFKYGYVYDMSALLSDFFLESIINSDFGDVLKNTLINNIPIAHNRLKERGFNQTYEIAKNLAKEFNLSFSDNLLGRKSTFDHQALKSKDERTRINENDFFIKDSVKISSFESITLVDDVITTGSTLEKVSSVLKKHYGKNLIVNAVCMFRGKPFYSSSGSTSG